MQWYAKIIKDLCTTTWSLPRKKGMLRFWDNDNDFWNLTHTHTCSETSYRITDVECISRAQNNPLKLTGMFGRFEVRNLSEAFLRLSSDAAQKLFLLDDIGRKSDCENRTTMNRTRSQQFNLSEAGTWLRRPSIISWRMAGASLDQARPNVPDPPALKRRTWT